ncbi:MAG: signal peptidase I [Solirubrobacteraceae bacterium]
MRSRIARTACPPRWTLALTATAVALAGCSISLSASNLRAWRVPSAAMEPTLRAGETVYTKSGRLHLRIDDVVIFHPPRGATRGGGLGVCGAPRRTGTLCSRPSGGPSGVFYIKRVVALGGQRVAMFGGHVVLDGEVQSEPFARTAQCVLAAICNYPQTITVPRGDAFVLGDDRGSSDDSRFWGPVPVSWIIGVAEICNSSRKHCRAVS